MKTATVLAACVLLRGSAAWAESAPPVPSAPAPSQSRVQFLGYARRIPHAWSASRNAPAFAMAFLPRDTRTASGEFSVPSVALAPVTLRLGFTGLLELESERETTRPSAFVGAGLGGNGTMFWRGSYTYQLSASFDAWSHAHCGTCSIELTAAVRHESDHYTGSNSGGQALDVRDRPYFGDSFFPDIAFAQHVGQWLLIARVESHFFFPGRSSYSYGPAVDLHLRYTRWAWVHPFVSGYADYLFGTTLEGRSFPNAYLLRALLGVALPSTLGDVMPYLSADVGHRVGLKAFTREATLGLGLRLALGTPP